MKKKRLYLCFISLFVFNWAIAQVGIGTTSPNTTSLLDLNSTSKGMLVPRMTLAQKIAIATPATGLLVYQTDGAAGFWYYTGTSWMLFLYSRGGTVQSDFHTLDIDKPSNSVTLNYDTKVSNSLVLTNGAVDLNGKTLTISNTATSAITKTNGYLISEQTDNSSKVKWTMNSTTGAHAIPFGTAAGQLIPLTINLTAGNIGDVTVSTYHTSANNLPMPTTPDNVVKITDYWGINNNANVVDRYWQIDKNGASGTSTITFTYLDAEVPANGETTMNAQRYNKATNTWDTPIGGQSQSAAANTVTTPGVTNYGAHTLVLVNNILPIELVDFNATLDINKVILKWTTATESNSDYFLIERSKDGINFEEFKKVNAVGYSRNTLKYAIIDDNPIEGKTYYRLKEYDFNNAVTNCGIKEIYYYKSKNLKVLAYPNPAVDEFNLMINKDVKGSAGLKVIDHLGQVVYSKDYLIESGDSKINLSCVTWPQGVYHVKLAFESGDVVDKTIVLF